MVGPKLTSACLGVLNNGNSIVVVNDTHLVLIPKKNVPVGVVDHYRLISLHNMIYNLVTKMIANRMNLVLPYLVSHQQSVFVLGHLITDNVVIASELLHSLSKKNNGRKGFMALKQNMSKAYDRVEWSFVHV